jgi:predicted ATPase
MEAGRGIIQAQVAIDGRALPWRDRGLFAELMLSWEMRSYHAAQQRAGSEPVIFDRGVPDIVGYLLLEGLHVPPHIQRAAETFRYNSWIFIAPPWPEIYRRDAERKQDKETARRTYDAMVSTYRDLGYSLIELPKVSVDARVEFVCAHIH